MGGIVSAVGNMVAAPVNAVGNLIGVGNIIPTGASNPVAPPPPPPPPAPLNTPAMTNPSPGANVIQARQDRIRRMDALRGTSAMGTTANILTGAKGDTSLTEQNKKNLLGA